MTEESSARQATGPTEEEPWSARRPAVDVGGLTEHLAERHGIRIAAVTPIDDDPRTRPRGSWPGHHRSTLVVRHVDGSRWIARLVPAADGGLDRVRGDVEILRFLTTHGFPAEPLAVEDPVSELAGTAVVVTRFVEGGRPSDAHGRSDDPAVQQELGSLLGRLHTLPEGTGALARDGGAQGTGDGLFLGRPARDLAAARSVLTDVEGEVGAEGRPRLEWLREQVERVDDAEGLPEALTHHDFHLWSVVGAPGALTVVGWAGSGRGPRLPALAWLLRTAAESPDDGPGQVAAVVRGYGEHVRLTDEELRRLPSVLDQRALWLACLELAMTVRAGRTPTAAGWLHPGSADHVQRLADQVRALAR